ncbi:MAG: YchF/TatD family DNA exonuclease [Candidatus Heimdallarchaeota archaeon]|nr:YchF/TatD family DNA exonuclease [Candidatus Heimdallarchaeota archaeon]
MKYIDTHCHIKHTLKKGAKMSELIARAKKANVIAIIDSPVYIEDYSEAIALHRKYANFIFTTLGLPPARYHELDVDLAIKKIHKYAKDQQIVGIGEVGLDYYWVKDQKTRENQHKVFSRFVSLANELKLPLIIHSRDAEANTLPILEKVNNNIDVVMHSFAASPEIALECADRGYYISIPTAVTNRKKHRKLAKKIPLESLVIETDSPYLSPLANKKRNEPAYVPYAAKEIAKIKELSEEEVARVTTQNAINLFQLPLREKS